MAKKITYTLSLKNINNTINALKKQMKKNRRVCECLIVFNTTTHTFAEIYCKKHRKQ